MGTETKINCYTENTSAGGIRIPKVVKGSSSSAQNSSHSNETKTNGKDSLNHGRTSQSAVPYVPIHIDENNVIEGAKEILRVIRPNWNLKEVEFKKFTDGITNKLVGCFNTPANNGTATVNGNSSNSNGNSHNHNTNGSSNHAHDFECIDDSGNLSDAETSNSPSLSEPPSSNVALVRVYGNKTDLLIDRKAETRNIILLHSYGFAPSLYATFKNGLVYDYVPGVTLNTTNVLLPEVWQLVARRMAEMHRMVKTSDQCADSPAPVPMLWKKTQSFFDLVPERFSDADKHKRLEGTFLPTSRMRAEFESLYRRLEALNSPLVFAHNDLLLGNVVYTESLQEVNFIDYEYADYNFQAFDIGNHFAEYAGVDEVDYARYPEREFQLEWLREYLQTYLQRSDIAGAEVERLYVQVNQFALASHFFWTIWCLIQAEHSTIDFDYVEYAFVRYNEYLARKHEFLALDMDSSTVCR